MLFAHWPVDPRALQKRIPPDLQLDTFDNLAWIGVMACDVTNVRLRPLLPLPRVSRFLEVSVRTYVHADDRPGVYFFSLDVSSLLAVKMARSGLRLPYFRASMSMERQPDGLRFRSRRELAPVHAQIDVGYRPAGAVFQAKPKTIEHFLVERYCQYARDHHRRLTRLEVHHAPWPLQTATADLHYNTLVDALDLTTPMRSPMVHYSARQDVLAWWPRRV